MSRDLRVRDVMSTDLLTLGRNDELSVADDLMKQKRVRHLPVLDEEGELCGILSQRDLFRGALLKALGYGERASEHMLHTVVVKEAMVESPRIIGPDASLAEAASSMIEHRIGCLPVVEGGKLVGLITEGDFVRQFVDDRDEA